jgi:hypothetical protein
MCIVVAVLILLSFAALLFGHRSDSQLPFDKKVWQDQEAQEDTRSKSIPDLWKHQEDGNVRFKMVNDLKPKLIGSNKADVEKLLGIPERDFDPINHPGDDYYLLGTRERFFDTDGLWLWVKFEKDRVDDVQVIHD